MNRARILLLLIISILSFSSCVVNDKKNEDHTKIEKKKVSENFDWLIGKWKRMNETENKETFEIWRKNNATEYLGIGFTILNNDTISQEIIILVKVNEAWDLKVQIQNEPTPIVFKMISYMHGAFICENKENDFPTLIKYWKNGNNLNALISGDDTEISFEFERIRQTKD